MCVLHKSSKGENDMADKPDNCYIGLDDAATYLNIKPVTLRKWIKDKKNSLPAHQIGKLWKFKRSELDEWVKSGKSAYQQLKGENNE